jgi:hypothetical protein
MVLASKRQCPCRHRSYRPAHTVESSLTIPILASRSYKAAMPGPLCISRSMRIYKIARSVGDHARARTGGRFQRGLGRVGTRHFLFGRQRCRDGPHLATRVTGPLVHSPSEWPIGHPERQCRVRNQVAGTASQSNARLPAGCRAVSWPCGAGAVTIAALCLHQRRCSHR